MKKALQILLLALLFLPGRAQGESYLWFHHINVTPDVVRTVCPDPSGRVWLGTSRGLFRLGDQPDAVRYDLFPTCFQRGINEISPFLDGQLLVRTQDGSLVVYDPVRNTVEEDFNAVLRSWGTDLTSRWSLTVKADNEGGLWCYEGDVLYRKEKSAPLARLVCRTDGPIRDVDYDGKDCVVVTDSLLYLIPVNDPGETLSFPHGIVFHRTGIWVVLDREGNLWVGSEGLHRFDRKTFRKDCLLRDISVMDMIRNRSGNVLVASGTAGIWSFSPEGSLMERIEHQPFELSSISSNNVRLLREDADGALWVSYNKPTVSVCRPGNLAFPGRHIPLLQQAGLEENVISLCQAPDGSVWFGTDGRGVFRRDAETGSFTAMDIPLPQPAVTALFFDSKGRTWIGTYLGGVYCLAGKKIRHFLPTISCFTILEDNSGDIWLGSQGDGLIRMNGSLEGDPVPVDMKYNRWVFQMAEVDDILYAATSNGLFRIDPDRMEGVRIEGNRSGTQQLCNRHFTSVVPDSRGLLWLAGNQSSVPLEVYDVRRDTILYIPQLEGHVVKSIVEDEYRNVWLSTEKFLFQIIVNYDPVSRQYAFLPSGYQFREQEASMSYNNPRAAIRLADGNLLFGGTAGYQQIPVSAFPPHVPLQETPAICVTALKIDDEYIGTGKVHGGRVILEKDISMLPGITLRHQENDVSLILSAGDYTSPFETVLFYRIQEKEGAWKQVRDNIIELNRLTPGRYDLEIAGGNPDGSLSAQILPFYVEIQAPWYATRWAYLLYFLLLGATVALLAYYYIDRQRRKISLEQIRQEADRQHQLNEMKLRFFTNISHDFRTPLSLIITPLETYLNDSSHKAEEPFFRPVYRNAVRLLNLVNQILDFRKLEADSVRLNLTYGNLVPFLRDICSSFTLFADEKSIRLDFEPQQEEILTSFDKDKLSKTVMNLLSNAFKFTPVDGSIAVRVKADGSDAVISVADTGPGIPDAQKEAVFRRFYQYQGDDAPYIGSGIGLHIVKEFVQLHGGSVSVSDNHPSGSVFTVRIPLRGKEASAAPDVEEEAVPDGGLSVSTGGKTILLVEDNADFRTFVAGQLGEKFTVYTAADGRSALQVLEKKDIDLIISDIMMEGMDGLELCKAVKMNLSTSHIPFILLTAKALAEDEIRGLELGADDYVTKPFHMQILLLRIQKLLDAQQQARQKFREKLDVAPSEITITSLDEQFLAKAVRLTEENMSDPDFSVEKLSSLIGAHRTHLYKKLLALTGKTPVEFIRTIRLKRAAQYLLQSQMYVSEIAYQVGFNSPKLFTRHFKEEFGMTPTEYQRQNGVGTVPEEGS